MKIVSLKPKSLTRNALADLGVLLSEFRPGVQPPNSRRWQEILAQRDVRIFAVRVGGKIIGIATLRWHELPIGRVGNLEDVVVGREHQGKGYGSALMGAIVDFAKKQKLAYIDLTTRPKRRVANHLYQKFGWERRKTNIYRLTL